MRGETTCWCYVGFRGDKMKDGKNEGRREKSMMNLTTDEPMSL